MTTRDPFELDDLRIDFPEQQPLARRTGRPRRWRKQFIRVPWSWVDRLKGAKSANTYRVALYLIYEYWRNGGRPIKLSNVALADMGVSPDAKRRALRDLSRLTLIDVDHCPRKAPVVTLALKPRTDE